jgi:glycosyltransferase involved in cell wall biosynthesis
MNILQVSASDVSGGAERSAKNLAEAYRARGHGSWLAVGHKRTDDPNVFEIPNDAFRNAATRGLREFRERHEPSIRRVKGLGRVANIAQVLTEPSRALSVALGHEDFDFPATSQLLSLTPERPDIVHLHNLHGDYFDLRELPSLSRVVPTILNVRDGWLMSGHCAFGLSCERWKTGCGQCPDLTLFPAIPRDATAYNWQRKRQLLADSRLYVTTPSRWMMDQVDQSIIAAAAVDRRIIPNGVDVETFFPRDRAASRSAIGVDADALVLMVAANGIRHNVWKDYATLRRALEILGARRWPAELIVLAIGEDAPAERTGHLELRFLPFQRNSERLAEFYSAADVYLHAARVESFGNVLLEARACGTPVVSTATGGIPEQVIDGETGLLVPQGDSALFAEAVNRLLMDAELRSQLSSAGLLQVRNEFTVAIQAKRFLDWYEEIIHA